jgi:hypothetical protein
MGIQKPVLLQGGSSQGRGSGLGHRRRWGRARGRWRSCVEGWNSQHSLPAACLATAFATLMSLHWRDKQLCAGRGPAGNPARSRVSSASLARLHHPLSSSYPVLLSSSIISPPHVSVRHVVTGTSRVRCPRPVGINNLASSSEAGLWQSRSPPRATKHCGSAPRRRTTITSAPPSWTGVKGVWSTASAGQEGQG